MKVPFLRHHALWCQTEDIKSSISDQAVVLRSGYGNSRVEEGRIFDGVSVEALGAVFEHGGRGGSLEVGLGGGRPSFILQTPPPSTKNLPSYHGLATSRHAVGRAGRCGKEKALRYCNCAGLGWRVLCSASRRCIMRPI